ncbi:MAG: DUF1295 domain-containing protein [Myxococcales bacterium]|nr:DUF1295 domain-containing protein [Myxococcales bacterium]
MNGAPSWLGAALTGWFALSALVFGALLKITAPYGRHTAAGWGPRLDARLGWLVMEAPAVLTVHWSFAKGHPFEAPSAWLFLTLWLVHYSFRAFIQPFLWRGRPTPMPWVIVALGALFNGLNGSLVGHGLFVWRGPLGDGWLSDPRCVLGVLLFVAGLAVNVHADEVLRRLRGPNESGYKVPHGGLYRYISCPNYFGEIVEWWGFALCTWHPASLAFAVWTTANLAPRALGHHRWYRATFRDYPAGRRALVPGLF